ncbi:MAG: DUF72 domain-containing protein, partial [Nitrospinota bacterium]
RWREAAPPSFEFALKAWQLITHPPSSPTYRRLRKPVPEEKRERYGFFRPTPEVEEAWEEVAAVAHALWGEVILFQTPASFRPTAEHRRNLRRFFREVRRESFRFAWEPRGEWTEEEVLSLCSECDLLPGGDPFAGGLYPGGWAYFRLHGGRGYRGRYGESHFAQLLAWARERERTYVFFNNLAMAEDCSRFLAWLQERGEG